MANSATRCPTDSLWLSSRSGSDPGTALEAQRASRKGVAKIGFEGGVRGIEQFPARDDDDVECRPWVVILTENLSNQSLSAISLNGVPELPRCHDSKPCGPGLVGRDNERHEASVHPEALVENPLKLCPATQTTVRAKSMGHGPRRLFVFTHGSPWQRAAAEDLSTTKKQSDASGPWPGGVSGQVARSWCSFERETRGSAGGGDDLAGTYAS
jgi:hypothetical protein